MESRTFDLLVQGHEENIRRQPERKGEAERVNVAPTPGSTGQERIAEVKP